MRPGFLYGLSFIFCPWIIVLILREAGPITHPPLTITFIEFIITFLTCAALGYTLGVFKPTPDLNKKIAHQQKKTESDFKIILSAAVLYTTLMAFDFFIIKGGTLTTITLIREEDNLLGSRMSPLGGLIAITSAAPFMLLNKIRHDWLVHNKPRGKGSFFFAVSGISISFLSGGRNAFLIGIVIYFCQEFLMRNIKIFNTKPKNKVATLFISAGVIFSFYLFIDRELNQGVNLSQLLSTFAEKWGVQIDEFHTEVILLDATYAAAAMFIFYLTHALNYIDQYFVYNISPMLMGVYNNPIPTKIVDIFFGANLFSSTPDKLLISGVYLTLPGSLYVDFGYIGANIFGLFIGLLTGLSWRLMASDSFPQVQLTSLLLAIWLLAPLYSVIGISNGLSFFVLGTILLLTKLYRFYISWK